MPADRHLLTVIASGRIGGGERLAAHLVGALAARGWVNTVLCGDGSLTRVVRREDPAATVCPVSLGAGGIFFGIRLGRMLLAAHRQRPRQQVLVHLNRAAWWAGWWRRLGFAPPVVAQVHGLNRATHYRFCDRLIAVSAAVAEHLARQGIPRDRIAVVPNAIPGRVAAALAGQSPGATGGGEVAGSGRVAKRSPPPPYVLGIVARLHANKGHAWALAAMAEALDRLPPFTLWIFGDGPERMALEQRWRDTPLGRRTHWLGHRHDLERFLPAVHWLLLPSLGEGIPLSLLEGFRFGIPCIATRVGGIPELVTDGDNGLLVPPGDAAALQRALHIALDAGAHAGDGHGKHGEAVERCGRSDLGSGGGERSAAGVGDGWSAWSARAAASFARVNRFDALLDGVEATLLLADAAAAGLPHEVERGCAIRRSHAVGGAR